MRVWSSVYCAEYLQRDKVGFEVEVPAKKRDMITHVTTAAPEFPRMTEVIGEAAD